MKSISSLVVAAPLALAVCTVATAPASAMDPICSPVNSATQLLRTTPVHIYMTETQSYANSKVADAAAQIGMKGTKQTEEISTGKTFYVLVDGKWVDMQISFAARENDKDADPDVRKALEESTCKALPDDAAFGQPAKVYLQNTPGLGIARKIWISKNTGLPIRTDTTDDGGAMKMMTVLRFEYGAVVPPPHAVTMNDMIKSNTR